MPAMPRWAPPLLVVALLVVASGTVAQTASVPPILAGSWRLASSTARALGTVEAAFEPGIATLPELFQNFARERLRASMAPPHQVDVGLTSSIVRVTFTSSERTTVVAGALDAHASVADAEGSPTVTPRIRDGWLELTWEGEGSVMRQMLSTEPDGSRMHLDYDVTSPQLPSTVRYRLDYVRAP
jgi:hypothetical protein